MTGSELAKSIDYTLLSPTATLKDVEKFCKEAVKYNFAAAFVSLCYVNFAAKVLKGTPVKVGAPVGFPFGSNTTAAKRFEATEAIVRGAREIDVVIDIGAAKAGDLEAVGADIEAVINSVRAEEVPEGSGTIIVKAIIETCYLSDEEKIAISKIVEQAGVDFVKTSTGFGPAGAVVKDVELLRKTLSSNVGVKASGGIRTLGQVIQMLDAGATRIGTSSAVKIMEEFLAKKESRS